MMYASFMQRLELSADFIVSAATARQSIWLSGVGPPTETNRRGRRSSLMSHTCFKVCLRSTYII